MRATPFFGLESRFGGAIGTAPCGRALPSQARRGIAPRLALFFIALATDYDGTLAQDGRVDAEVCRALEAFKSTGRRLILVTGRQLPDLLKVFPGADLFDRIIAENGAVIYSPDTAEERAIAPPPPPAFLEARRREKVEPLSVGRSIVAT
jgi:hypothetical protein